MNKDIHPYQSFDKMQIRYLKSLVCEDVIEEYRLQPLGQHSESLQRLLHYFWRLPIENKYGIKRNTLSGSHQIIQFSGIRGVAPKVVDENEYDSIEQAYHGIFLKHINTLMESQDG